MVCNPFMVRPTPLPKGDKVETLFWQSKEEHSVRLPSELTLQISCFSSAQIEEEHRLERLFWREPFALSFIGFETSPLGIERIFTSVRELPNLASLRVTDGKSYRS
jgi:hypothetical protein